MRTVALETTSTAGSLAGLVKGRVLEEIRLDSRLKTAKSFAPALHDLLKQLAWRPKDIQCVAVAKGPGSFTGLRIGVTAAKTLAYASGAMLIGVNTLECIAQRAPAGYETLEVALDAQRQQVFAGAFRRSSEGDLVWQSPTQVLDEEAWLRRLPCDTTVAGPVLARLRGRLPVGVRVLPESSWEPTATGVGEIAWRLSQSGHCDDMFQLVPAYFRLSAAEEKWNEKQREAG